MNFKKKLKAVIPNLTWQLRGQNFITAEYFDYVVEAFSSNCTQENDCVVIKDKRLDNKHIETIYQASELVDLAFSTYLSQNKDESRERSKAQFYERLK